MSRRPYLAGVAILVTLLLSSALGVEWVEVVGGVDPNAAPPAPAALPAGIVSSSGAITPPIPPPPTPDFLPMPLDYIYLFDNGTGGNYIPWWGQSYYAMRFQALYLASEINKAGSIAQIGLFKNYYASYYNTFQNASVKLCHTGVTSLTTNWNNNYDGHTPVWVWHGDLPRGCASAGVYDTLDLTTNFSYNGTDNLIVEVLWSGRTAAVGVPSYTASGSGNRRAYNYQDTTSNPLGADATANSCRLGFLGVPNDVGVTQITAPAGWTAPDLLDSFLGGIC